MGMFSFIKEAGEKLFGRGEAKAAQEAAAAAPTPENIAALSKTAGDAIETYIGTMNLNVEALDVTFDAPTGTVTVAGVAPDQATKEKVLRQCGVGHCRQRHDDGVESRGRVADVHRRQRRQPVENQQAVLRHAEQIHADI